MVSPVRRSVLFLVTIALAAGAAVGVLLLAFATGHLYIDEPDPDPPLAAGWLDVAVVAGAGGVVIAVVGLLRNDWVSLLGAIPPAALTLTGLVLLATA